MIKLNYFVRFVAFQIGSGQGRLGRCRPLRGVQLPPTLPIPPTSKPLAPPFVCRARPREEEEEGKVRNAFIRHSSRLCKPHCCTLGAPHYLQKSQAKKEREGESEER